MAKLSSKVESYKSLAEIFLKEDKPVFIKDINGDYYFAKILLIGEETLLIECFSPDHRKGQRYKLYWVSISRFDEYKPLEEKE